jgi:DNA-binding MarR family transcriptional regulator
MCLSHSGTTRLITRLERRELIARRLCTTDRRALEVELTAAGHELLGRIRPAGSAALAGVLGAEGARLADGALARVLRPATGGTRQVRTRSR